MEDDKEIRLRLQQLSREVMIKNLLADIATDLVICDLEGYDPREYPLRIKQEMERILNKLQ